METAQSLGLKFAKHKKRIFSKTNKDTAMKIFMASEYYQSKL